MSAEEKNTNQDEFNSEEILEELSTGKSELEVLKEENEKLKQEVANAKNDALRAAADADNFRKRMAKEAEDRAKYAGSKILESLLPVLDHLEMALAHAGEDSPLKQGVELTLKQMLENLAKNGLEKINTEVGAEFDPNFAEALMLDNNDEYPNNAITMVLQNGYTLNGRVLRPTKVKVNKK